MILHALEIITGELNAHLDSIASTDEPVVIIGNVATMEGAQTYTPPVSDKVILSVVRIEEEKTLKNVPAYTKNVTTNKVDYHNPPVHLNLYLLFSMNTTSYASALVFLSRIIRFFQNKKIFTTKNSPGTYSGNDHDFQEQYRLLMDLYTPSFEEANHLWSIMGGKQLPNVVYKMRMLELKLDQTQEIREPISEISIDGGATNL